MTGLNFSGPVTQLRVGVCWNCNLTTTVFSPIDAVRVSDGDPFSCQHRDRVVCHFDDIVDSRLGNRMRHHRRTCRRSILGPCPFHKAIHQRRLQRCDFAQINIHYAKRGHMAPIRHRIHPVSPDSAHNQN
jgi:hypothetical protein